jgi:hypothetical protein
MASLVSKPSGAASDRPAENQLKRGYPGGRKMRMDGVGAISWKASGGIAPIASSAAGLRALINLDHCDHGCAGRSGRP